MNYIYNLLKRHAESLMCIPDKTETLSFIGISAYSGSQISKTSFREISNGSFTSISAYSDSQRQTIQSNRLPFDFLIFSDFFSLLF